MNLRQGRIHWRNWSKKRQKIKPRSFLLLVLKVKTKMQRCQWTSILRIKMMATNKKRKKKWKKKERRNFQNRYVMRWTSCKKTSLRMKVWWIRFWTRNNRNCSYLMILRNLLRTCLIVLVITTTHMMIAKLFSIGWLSYWPHQRALQISNSKKVVYSIQSWFS